VQSPGEGYDNEPTPLRPIQETLQGGIDLASPVQNAGRQFLTQLAMQGGTGLVMIGVTNDGQVLTTSLVPGGLMQLLGMLQMASLSAFHHSQHGPPPSVTQPPEGSVS
jgi:hypothetical protein